MARILIAKAPIGISFPVLGTITAPGLPHLIFLKQNNGRSWGGMEVLHGAPGSGLNPRNIATGSFGNVIWVRPPRLLREIASYSAITAAGETGGEVTVAEGTDQFINEVWARFATIAASVSNQVLYKPLEYPNPDGANPAANSTSFALSILQQYGFTVVAAVLPKLSVVESLPGKNTLLGLKADEDLSVTDWFDTILAGQGKDILRGSGGNDYLFGGSDNDTIFASAGGSDVIHGGQPGMPHVIDGFDTAVYRNVDLVAVHPGFTRWIARRAFNRELDYGPDFNVEKRNPYSTFPLLLRVRPQN